MPRINYPVVITESEAALAELERQLRHQSTHPRVQLLRLLKTGQAHNLLEAAPLVGYSVRQVNRWWGTYRQEGLEVLLQVRPRLGKHSRLTGEACQDLEAAMARGEIATLKDCQRYLREHWQIEYHSLHGLWYQLDKHGIRLKTGRRRHRRAAPAVQDAWKRGLRPTARAPGLYAGLGV